MLPYLPFIPNTPMCPPSAAVCVDAHLHLCVCQLLCTHTETTARLDAWLRPRAVMRYILKTADLTAASNEISTSNRPKDWQLMLEDAISSWGAVLLADKDNSNVMVLSQNDRRCKTTFEVCKRAAAKAGQERGTLAAHCGWAGESLRGAD